MKKYTEDDILLLLKEIQVQLRHSQNQYKTNAHTIIEDSIIELSKVHGLQFKNCLDSMIQRINIEIGLNGFKFDSASQKRWDKLQKVFFNGLGPWAKTMTIARLFGSRI
ncbi:hypothetical protein JZO81_21280 [Enterococcus hulanensis]|uniref:hypothetical protein n=1 Tax=Enterococcus TaxID=1350 RepID=UPI000B5A85B5|nr:MULTISPECIES: hypothetical protein [Enterococcus]MBO0413598.1 hypothetical protein [Enterococcus hulanensis]